MSNGLLQFSLGMGTGQFLQALTQATSKVKGFVGGLIGLGAIVDGVKSQFEKGAGLEQLHKRTGASVGDLYKLQKGFQAVGLNAEDVGPAVFIMQRALGGVSEMGESTANVFSRLGLNIANLKRGGAAAALDTILLKLKGLNQNDAAKAATMIFGRGQAANMLVAARSMTEFQRAMDEAGPQAAVFERVAKAFEKIDILVSQVKSKFGSLFTGIAAGLAPAITASLEWLKKMESSLAGIGQNIGNMFRGVLEAFKEGKITELLELAFSAAVEFFANFLAGIVGSSEYWAGIWKVMTGEFVTAFAVIFKIVASIGQVLAAAFDTAFQKLFEWIGKTPKLGKMLGLENYHASSFSDNFANRKKEGADGQSVIDEMTNFGVGRVGDGVKQQFSAVAKALTNAGGPQQEKLKQFWSGLVARAPGIKPSEDGGVNPGAETIGSGSRYKPEFTSLEKMGFVMGGASNPMKRSEDLLAQIVRNTAPQSAGAADSSQSHLL